MTPAALKAAAALADPIGSAASDAVAGDVTPAMVLEILRSNKVPLLDLDGARQFGPGLRPIVESALWREAVDSERRERDALTAELREVARRFSDRGITSVLFKSTGGVPYRSSNVDLLVRPARMADAERILTDLGHLRFPHYREDRKLLFRRFRRGRSVICVHLHEAVSWGKILILEGAGVVDRCREPRGGAEAAGCRVASPEDLLLATLAHSVYETDQVRLSDLRAVRLCAAGGTFDWEAALARVRRHGWTEGFFSILRIMASLEISLHRSSVVPRDLLDGGARDALRVARWAGRHVERTEATLARDGAEALPYRIPKRYTKLHYVVRLLRSPERSGEERLADLAATAWDLLANRLRLRCRPAAVISLSGLDGSGKSTAIRVLREAMTLCEIPVRVVWSRGGFTIWTEAVKKAARSAMPRAIPGPGQADAKHRWLGRPLRGALFSGVVVTEQALHYLLRVRMPRWLGCSIVCDRFAYDTQADLEAKLGRRRRLGAMAGALMTKLAPRPDLAILLRLSPQEAARRKPGDAPVEAVVRSQAAALDRLAAIHGLITVDADRSIEDVVDDVVDLALRASFARFGGVGR